MSSSTVPMPVMPNLLTSRFVTFGERKAGSVGPKWIFLTPRYNSAKRTMTAFCSYQAMLYEIGSSLISASPNASFSFSAITASEYESLHWPASKTRGMPSISPKSSLLYLYLAHPAVRIRVSFGSRSANSV